VIFRRKAIYEELHGKSRGGDRRSESARENQSDNLSFCSATAEATGKDRRSVERAAARGEALGDDLGAVTGTSLDKGVELDALAKLPKDCDLTTNPNHLSMMLFPARAMNMPPTTATAPISVAMPGMPASVRKISALVRCARI
jgi:hypothetical protein